MTDAEYRKDLYEMFRLKQKLAVSENPEMPRSISKQLNPSVRNYFESDTDHQILLRLTNKLRGKTDKYVYQVSNGSQQVKLYEPHKYRNNINSPLRIRTRMIMHLAHQNPGKNVRKKVQELHYTYPYYLLKEEAINLRLRNFRFVRAIQEGEVVEIYKKMSSGEPDPSVDMLVDTIVYEPKKGIKFEYRSSEEESFYALNIHNNELSNVLNFVWQDELQQLP